MEGTLRGFASGMCERAFAFACAGTGTCKYGPSPFIHSCKRDRKVMATGSLGREISSCLSPVAMTGFYFPCQIPSQLEIPKKRCMRVCASPNVPSHPKKLQG
jgi:hypothetical protein